MPTAGLGSRAQLVLPVAVKDVEDAPLALRLIALGARGGGGGRRAADVVFGVAAAVCCSPRRVGLSSIAPRQFMQFI